ncbi:DUF6493 family protein [Streptomyces sp. TRM49041]|uniref:DUF6493 family protein n=1 Tax=Streptomyces sp. TRM49041 TaxID=2603216 RepID=UPI0011ED815C|nr:DUF6493 family protein [Streptomyces sp. TRM49041]
MKELLDAVRQGRAEDVPGLVKSSDAAGRKGVLGELKTLRAEARNWGWDQWEKRRRVHHALLVAGAGCHGGAAAAATWIGARDLRDWRQPPYGLLLDVLHDRDAAWLGDVAHRLAGRAATAREDYPLVHELVRRSGCPVPVTDGYVYGWVDELSRRGRRPDLSADPQAPVLVPRLFETAELADGLSWKEGWTEALVALPGAGAVERAVLVDGCVARLLRGGRASDLRFFLGLLRTLELTADEERARTADWMGLAADAPSTVAGHAQDVLSRLAASGDLSARRVAEVSASVLFRTEKKLVRAQLVLLGKVLRRDRDAAGELLPVVAEVFGHEDTALQERALKLVGRHLDAVGGEVRRELADTAAALLSPVHRAVATEVFGGLPDQVGADGPYEDLLPPVPEPQRVAPAARTLPELVEEVAALLRSGEEDVIDVERALDGLTRSAYEDLAALREAIMPLLADEWWWGEDRVNLRHVDGVRLVAAAAAGRVRLDDLRRVMRSGSDARCVHRRLERIREARAQEVAWRIMTEPLPFLLATPAWHTGTVEPAELVERLAAYGRLGAGPAECDVAQALLRVRRTGPGVAEAAEAAAALGTPEGTRLAGWLTDGELYGPGTREVVEMSGRGWAAAVPSGTGRIVVSTPGQPVIQREFPPAFRALGSPWSATGDGCHHWWATDGADLAVLPEDRETLAAWLLPVVTLAADADVRDVARPLPALVEAGGEAGPALHLALGCGLGARHTEDRLAAVDALLVLAAREQLDAARLGGDLAALVGLGTVKLNRLADSLRTAAATGAYATLWAVLASALPALLTADEPPRGLGGILAVAADCAERCGAAAQSRAGATVDGLDAVAARPGSSQVVVQARRLVNALRQPTGQPAS